MNKKYQAGLFKETLLYSGTIAAIFCLVVHWHAIIWFPDFIKLTVKT